MKKLIVAAVAFMIVGAAAAYSQNTPAPKKSEAPKTHVAKKTADKPSTSTAKTDTTGHKKGKHKKHNS